MEHLLEHTVIPFQEVVCAWRVWGSLYNLLVPRVERVLTGTVSVPMPRLLKQHQSTTPGMSTWLLRDL